MLKERYAEKVLLDMVILKRFEILENVILNSNLKTYMKPLFYYYFKSSIATKEELKNYFMHNAVIFKLLNAKEKDILEVGCGFGLNLICISLMGARKVVGIDISKEMIEGFQKLIKRFPKLDIEAKMGDFLLTEYPPSSFDAIFLVEAISHIRDTHFLLDKIKDVLRPNGVLYISDGNNDFFVPSRIRARIDWKKAEKGPIDENTTKYGRKVDKLCFFDARVKIIRNVLKGYAKSELDDRMLKLIAKKTQGMWGEEINKATKEFIITGKIKSKASFPYRNPYTGEFPEMGFNPFKLINELSRKGFQCRFVPPAAVYITSNIGLNKYILSLLSPILRNSPQFLLPLLCPSFQIIATKEGTQ